jgi:hypothetical protein
MTNNGSAYGRENRQLILAIKEDIAEIKKGIEDLRNHYSHRLPLWASTLITILTSLSIGLIVYAILK